MEEIDLVELFKMLWRKKIIIILSILIGVILGYAINSYVIIPEYKATATFLLANTNDESSKAITTTDVTLNSKIINNYTELIKSDRVLDDVLKELNITVNKQKLIDSIKVNVRTGTEFVELSVTLPQKEKATVIANKVVEVLGQKVKEIYNVENVRIVDKATVPTEPCNIEPKKWAIIGGGIGLLASCVIILIINVLDDTVRESEVEERLKLKVMATFRKVNRPDGFDWNPKLDYVEAFKALRTNLQFSKRSGRNKCIAISSTNPGEGKSWIASNLAMAFSRANYKVLLIDTDLRKGVQHIKFQISQKPGLIQLIKGNEQIENIENWDTYIKDTEFENIFVLPSGGAVIESSELLLSSRLEYIINEMREKFDVIILDSTPSALITDAVVLSRLVDTNIIVTEYHKTKFKDLKDMKNKIQSVGGNISGVVINKVTTKKKQGYYYGSENFNKDKEFATKR